LSAPIVIRPAWVRGFERVRPSVEAPGRDVDDCSPSLTRPYGWGGARGGCGGGSDGPMPSGLFGPRSWRHQRPL